MNTDIRTAAQRMRMAAEEHLEQGAHFSLNDPSAAAFIDGAAWAQSRVTPTREQLATEIAKHFRIGDEVDGGYYCGCGEGDYRDANHVADAVLALIAAEGSE